MVSNNASCEVSAGNRMSIEFMPASVKARSLAVTYEQDAGSFPTNTTANPGVTPVRSFNVSTFVLISARIFEANALPSII